MKITGWPGIVLILTPEKRFKASDIASILHRQKGGGFDLFVVACPKAQKIPENLKKMVKSVFVTDEDSIGDPLNHILSVTKNPVFAFLTDRVIPTHDHWLKRICDPILNCNTEAVFGKEIPPLSGNYFLIKDIEKRFHKEGNGVDPKHFSINNCALARPTLARRWFPEKSVFDPAAYWVNAHSMTAVYQPEAIVTRNADDSLKEIYSRYRHLGADRAAAGVRIAFWETADRIAADTVKDIRLSLSMKKPHHAWYPPLYRSAMHLGYYLGQRGAAVKNEKS